ncbi:MAG: hypothetical protein ACOC5T_01625 [Elusimicrobiota bacterium]
MSIRIKHEDLICPKCNGKLFNIKIIGMSEDERLEVIAKCVECKEELSTKQVKKQKKNWRIKINKK